MDREKLLLKFKEEAEKKLVMVTSKINETEQIKNVKERIRSVKLEDIENFSWFLNMPNEELFNMLKILNIEFDENSIIMFKYILNSKEVFEKSNSNRLIEATEAFKEIGNKLRRISMTSLKSQELMELKRDEALLKDLIPKIKKNYIDGSFASIMAYKPLFDSFYELTDDEIFEILQLMVNSDLTVIKQKSEKDFEKYNNRINEELNDQEELEILDQKSILKTDEQVEPLSVSDDSVEEKLEDITDDLDTTTEETTNDSELNNETNNINDEKQQNNVDDQQAEIEENKADYEKVLGKENFNLINEMELSAVSIMSNNTLYNMSEKDNNYIKNILALYKNNKISISEAKMSMYDSSLYLNFIVDAIISYINEIREYMNTYVTEEEAIIAKEDIIYYLNKAKELYECLKKEILLIKETNSITPKNTPMRILYYGNGDSELTEFEKSLKDIAPEHFSILYDIVLKLENANFNNVKNRHGLFSKIHQDLYILYKPVFNNHIVIFSCGYQKDISLKTIEKEQTTYGEIKLSKIEDAIREDGFEYKKMYNNSEIITEKLRGKSNETKIKGKSTDID